ncbi:MAG TPA: pitrilysin family protein [Polyangiaceae bacterium]|jgi:zinc protease
MISPSPNALSPEPAPREPLVLIESSRALPLVSISVALQSGSVAEPEAKEGLMRMTARLMRRTGGGLSTEVLDARIDSLGSSLGAEVGHSTAAFHATVLRRSLEPLVDLLVDVVARPGFAEEEFGRLKREAESELVDARDNDRSLVRRWFRRSLFPDHPYGRRVGGCVRSIRTIDLGDVHRMFESALVPDNLVFAFSGDIDREAAETCARRITGALGAGAPPEDKVTDPQIKPGRHLVIVNKPERTQTQILIGGLGSHPSDPDHTALLVANTVFGGTFTARMTREVRSKRGWSYGAYSDLPYDRRREAFTMWTFPKAGDAAACIRLELELLKNWRKKGITKRELLWAKRYLVRSHAFSVDTAAKRVGLALDEVLFRLPQRYHAEYTERVQAVTLDQANESVETRISEENLLVAVVGTESEIGSAVRQAIDGLASTEVIAYDRED